MEMDKESLRRSYKTKRSLLSTEEITVFQQGIQQQLMVLDWQQARYVHSFLPIQKQNEPDMWAFLAYMEQQHPAVQLVVSRSVPEDYSMQHFLWRSDILLKENAWGIFEPVEGEQIGEESLDVVLVPLLVADHSGNRVGYGKGFYDRFLARCRPDCCKIGVSFFDPVDEIEDIDPFDVALDRLVTPRGTIQFKK